MNPIAGVSHAWHWSTGKFLSRWIRATLKPDDVAASIASRPRPVCYVLEWESHADLAILNMVCAEHNLPDPERRISVAGTRTDKAYFELLRRPSMFGTRGPARAPKFLVQLVHAAAAHPEFDVDLVPVA